MAGGNNERGFSLIELIIVVIIIGVLSIAAASRFIGRGGFDSVSLQNRVISALRQMQLRAMQDTRDNFCHQLNFVLSPAAIGPPTNDYSAGNEAATCATSVGADTPDYLRVDNALFDEFNASLSVLDGSTAISSINFESLGRPVTAVTPSCSNDCTVTLTTTSTSQVCINSEGFIRAC